MELSYFFAKIFGILFLIFGVGTLIRRDFIKETLDDLSSNRLVRRIAGMLALIIGVIMIVVHNIWEMSWVVIITLLGWASLVKGLMRLFYQEEKINKMLKMIAGNSALVMFMSLFASVLGVYLIYVGFWAI